MRHLELAAQQSKKVTREEAVANAKATAEQLGKQLPISLDNGVTVVRYAPRSPCGTHSFNQHGTYVMRHSLLFHFVCHSMSVYRSVWAACCIIFACCVDTCLLYHMLAAARAISALCTVTGKSFLHKHQNLRRHCTGSSLPHPSPCNPSPCGHNALLLYQSPCNCNKIVLLCLYRLGRIDDRPSYHSQTQLWPVGYQATWQDGAAGTFHCDILDGGEEGPLFAVSLVPPRAEEAAHVSCSTISIQCCDTQCCKATPGVQVLWGIPHEKHRKAGVKGTL